MNSSPVGSETAWAIAVKHNGGARCRVDAEAEDVGAGVVPDRVELASLETDQVDVDLGVENPFLLFERASEDPSAGSDDRGRPRHNPGRDRGAVVFTVKLPASLADRVRERARQT